MMTSAWSSLLWQHLAMGGYAAYVWPAFALALGILAYNVVKPYRAYRALLKQLRSNPSR